MHGNAKVKGYWAKEFLTHVLELFNTQVALAMPPGTRKLKWLLSASAWARYVFLHNCHLGLFNDLPELKLTYSISQHALTRKTVQDN